MKGKAIQSVLHVTLAAWCATAFAATAGDSYRVGTSVISGGVGFMQSESYGILSSLGQPAPLLQAHGTSFSGSYQLQHGFWYTVPLKGESDLEVPFTRALIDAAGYVTPEKDGALWLDIDPMTKSGLLANPTLRTLLASLGILDTGWYAEMKLEPDCAEDLGGLQAEGYVWATVNEDLVHGFDVEAAALGLIPFGLAWGEYPEAFGKALSCSDSGGYQSGLIAFTVPANSRFPLTPGTATPVGSLFVLPVAGSTDPLEGGRCVLYLPLSP